MCRVYFQVSPPDEKLQAYIERISEVNHVLHAVSEINPDALCIARALDAERLSGHVRGPLHGVPILIKDNIASMDEMNTTGELHLLISLCAVTDISISRIIRTTRS